jgi:hypothetical protein
VLFQEGGGFPAQPYAEPGFPEISWEARQQDHDKERHEARAQRAGTDHEELQRHGNGHERRNEDGGQTEALEPSAKAHAAAGLSAFHESAAATPRDQEEGDISHHRTGHGDSCVPVGIGGFLYG